MDMTSRHPCAANPVCGRDRHPACIIGASIAEKQEDMA